MKYSSPKIFTSSLLRFDTQRNIINAIITGKVVKMSVFEVIDRILELSHVPQLDTESKECSSKKLI